MNFKAWFRDSKVVDENGNPAVAYHGTRSDFDEFSVGEGKNVRFDRILGPHFAMDSSVASTFTTDRDTYDNEWPPGKATAGRTAGGNVKPVFLSIQNPRVMDQAAPAGAGLRPDFVSSDEQAVAHDILNETMPHDKEGFAQWFSKSRHSTVEAGRETFDKLSSGQPVEGHSPDYIWHKKLHPVAAFVANFDSMMYAMDDDYKKTIVKEYKRRMEAKGYDGIRYINTAPMEIAKAKSRITYIAFRPEQIKSATGNRGTFDPKDKRITHGLIPKGSDEYSQLLEAIGIGTASA